jgi:DNA polymerase III alpha subunit
MKRTIGGGDEARKKAKAMRDGFVEGAIRNGYDAQVAENLYDKILWFAGYGFNKAHAVSYAIDSYYCAWLMTYHEEEWLSAYLESMSSNPDDRAKAFAEVRGLGYKISNVDVNYAAGSGILDSAIAADSLIAPLAENSTLMQLMILNQDIWYTLPAFLIIAMGFLHSD